MSLMSFFAFFGFLKAEPIDINAPAPEAEALTQDGEKVKLSDFYKRGTTLVYFYPKSDTPGCTKQACSLRDGFETLTTKGVQIIGVSNDTVADQKKFATKYKLPFTLLADKEATVIKAFGVAQTAGFASRQSFLIHDGKIVWRDLSASTEKQAEDVLHAIELVKNNGTIKN